MFLSFHLKFWQALKPTRRRCRSLCFTFGWIPSSWPARKLWRFRAESTRTCTILPTRCTIILLLPSLVPRTWVVHWAEKPTTTLKFHSHETIVAPRIGKARALPVRSHARIAISTTPTTARNYFRAPRSRLMTRSRGEWSVVSRTFSTLT